MLKDFSFLIEGIEGIKLIEINELIRLLEDHADDVFLIDVRSAEEFNDGHLEGAINWPHSEIIMSPGDIIDKYKESKQRSQNIDEVLIVTYCMRGIRSGNACLELMSNFPRLKIANLFGGLKDWKNKGGRVV